MTAREDYPILAYWASDDFKARIGYWEPGEREQFAHALDEIDELRYQKSRLQAEKTALLQQVAYR